MRLGQAALVQEAAGELRERVDAGSRSYAVLASNIHHPDATGHIVKRPRSHNAGLTASSHGMLRE